MTYDIRPGAATVAAARRAPEEVTAQIAKAGRSSPLGPTVYSTGVNFSLYSRDALRVDLLFFDRENDSRPSRIISLVPVVNRTNHYWHAFVPGVQPGQLYGFRAYGPYDPSSGLRFDATKVLLDPYGRSVVVPKNYSREAAGQKGDNAATAMKSAIVDPRLYDWEGDSPINRLPTHTIV